MTTITGDVGVGWGSAPSAVFPGKSYVRVRPADTVTTDTGVTMLPVPAPKEIASDGTWSLSIDPLPATFAYVFEFIIDAGRFKSRAFTKLVPATGSHAFADLEDVVAPGGGGYAPPPWTADVFTARDETLAAASDVVELQDATIAGRIVDPDSETKAALSATSADIAKRTEAAVGMRRAVADVVNGRIPASVSSELPAIAADPATRRWALGAIVSVVAPGSGYVVGEVLTLAGGAFTTPAQVKVTSVSGGGVTGVSIYRAGIYTASPPAGNYQQASSSGAGTGLQLTLQFSGRPSALNVDESTAYAANGGILRFTGNGPANIASTGAFGNAVGNGTACFFDFETDASAIEIVMLAFNSEYAIFVDDRRIGLDALLTDSSGSWIVAQLTYATSKKRRVRVFCGKNGGLHSVRIATTGGRTVTAPTVARMLAWGLGDSYMFGTGARALAATSFMTMCAELGIDGLPDGIGGAGWVNSTGGSALARVNAKLAALTRTPDIIVWDLGYNERSSTPSTVVAAMESAILRAKELVPNAQHIAFSPATPLGETGQLLALKQAMAAKLAELNVHMVDQSNWVTSRTRALYTSTDNDHPTPAGHDLIGARKAAAVRPYLQLAE